VWKPNAEYRVREHLIETEAEKLLAALKRNRNGHRDWLIGLLIYRHGLRVSEACDLRWDDLDLAARTIVIRRLRDRGIAPTIWKGMSYGACADFPGAAPMSSIPFSVHVHILRHPCGCALANKGMVTRRLQHYLGHASITNTVRCSAMSPEPFRDIWR
jgi:site-specific recombinase XerD